MSIAEKLTAIAENTPKVFNAGFEKGKAENGTAKEEQEKTINITENGTTEVFPDDNKTLSKVTVDVNVSNSGFDYDAHFESRFNSVTKNALQTGNYNALFANMYIDDITFKPTQNITPKLAVGMFQNCCITNLKQILEERNVTLDTSQCTNFNIWLQYSTISHLPCISFEGTPIGGTVLSAFATAASLLYIKKIIVRSDIVWNNCFLGTQSLITIAEIEGEFGTSLNMASCSKLDDLTIDNIINAYADMTGQTAPILTVHPDVKAKIEANETWLNMLINKNVTLA